MVLIKTKLFRKIPDKCPKCNGKLHHVNALDTKAEIYMVFCLNTINAKYVCKYCQDWSKEELLKWA